MIRKRACVNFCWNLKSLWKASASIRLRFGLLQAVALDAPARGTGAGIRHTIYRGRQRVGGDPKRRCEGRQLERGGVRDLLLAAPSVRDLRNPTDARNGQRQLSKAAVFWLQSVRPNRNGLEWTIS